MSRRKPSTPTELPIWEGEMIVGTHLIRRYQGDKEVAPRYTAWNGTHDHTAIVAMDEATMAGCKTVQVGYQTYAFLWGDWVLLFSGDRLCHPEARSNG